MRPTFFFPCPLKSDPYIHKCIFLSRSVHPLSRALKTRSVRKCLFFTSIFSVQPQIAELLIVLFCFPLITRYRAQLYGTHKCVYSFVSSPLLFLASLFFYENKLSKWRETPSDTTLLPRDTVHGYADNMYRSVQGHYQA